MVSASSDCTLRVESALAETRNLAENSDVADLGGRCLLLGQQGDGMSETEAVLLPPVATNGKAFVTGSGTTMKRFMVRGVAVSSFDQVLKYDDLLSDEHYAYMESVILPK